MKVNMKGILALAILACTMGVFAGVPIKVPDKTVRWTSVTIRSASATSVKADITFDEYYGESFYSSGTISIKRTRDRDGKRIASCTVYRNHKRTTTLITVREYLVIKSKLNSRDDKKIISIFKQFVK